MNITLQEIYDGFAKTYVDNRGLFDMTEVFNSFYGCLDVEKGRLLDLGGCPRIQKAGIIKIFRQVQYSNNVYSF